MSDNPPAYLGCTGIEVEPEAPSKPTTPTPTNPIKFMYSISTNNYAFQNGIRLEWVGGPIPQTIQHVVPSALPDGQTFTQTVELTEGELYAFTVTDSFGNGIESIAGSVVDPSKLTL